MSEEWRRRIAAGLGTCCIVGGFTVGLDTTGTAAVGVAVLIVAGVVLLATALTGDVEL